MADILLGRLGVAQLVALFQGAHVKVWPSAFEAHPIVVQLFDDVQAFAVEVPQSPVRQSGFSRSLHCQLRSADLVAEIQRERV